jgi:hypothetical protein
MDISADKVYNTNQTDDYGKEKGFFQTEGIFSPLLLQAVLQFLSQKQASFHLHAIPFSYVDLP